MAMARLTHLRISIPSSGAPPGQVPMECFPEATAPVSQSHRRRVSFAEEVTTLNTEVLPEFSPVSPPLILPVVVEEAAVVSATRATSLILPVVGEIDNDPPAAELGEMQTTTPESGVPPPLGFPPFLFPENDGGMDANDICARFGGLASLTISQTSRESSDILHTTDVPERCFAPAFT